MKINDTSSEMLQTVRTQPVRPIAQEPQSQPRPDSAAPAAGRSDSVQISSAGRALAAQASDGATEAELAPERVAALRQQVLVGAYNSLQMVDEVARRILERGDV